MYIIILIFSDFPNTIDVLAGVSIDAWVVVVMIDMLIDTLAGMLTNLIIGVVTAIGFDVLADANIDVLKAVMSVVVFALPASPEKSFLLCCTPCKF